MKIALLSDLHIEFGEYTNDLPDADILLLAGDITIASQLKNYKEFISRTHRKYGKKNVFLIDGNHNGYNGSIGDFSNTQLSVDLGDYHLLACTLWSGKTSKESYKYLNDMNIVGFSWEWMYRRHLEDLKFIRDNLLKIKKPVIIMTHHIPTLQGVNIKWHSSNINDAFYTDLDWLIEEFSPAVWCFGHTHDSVDKLHSNGKTRLICNPRGYVRNGSPENIEFDPNFTFCIE